MWLINASTLMLQEFFDDDIPPYDILSHTWSEEEVTFQDMQNGTGTSKAGYHKIQQTCALSLKADQVWRSRKFVWIDSCCIDKTSSAHLSEAINSMYQYYKRASACYVYLADMERTQGNLTYKDIKHCRWFKRSWTLQELIAPRSVAFFDRHWGDIGTKEDLLEHLVAVTRIDARALQNPQDLPMFSIAQRMSWAAGRKATRKEDIAYSLLGIFDVNMPLLYGEGPKAFLRLQEEIMRQSDDQSLFAWGDDHASDHVPRYDWRNGLGFLAKSPDDFASSADVGSYTTHSDRIWTMTNRGIQVSFPMLKLQGTSFVSLLNCYRNSDLTRRLAILTIANPDNPTLHSRAPCGLIPYDLAAIEQNIETGIEYFWVKIKTNVFRQNERSFGIFIKPNDRYKISVAVPKKFWSPRDNVFRPPPKTREWFAHLQVIHRKTKQVYFLFIFITGREAFVHLSSAHGYAWPHDRPVGQDEEVLDTLDVPYDWKAMSQAPKNYLRSDCTIKTDAGHQFKATVTTEDVMDQSMFVVEVRQTKGDEKAKDKFILTSRFDRLALGRTLISRKRRSAPNT